jgi:aminoglycoside phosphotransferase (APT) family kinase protein
MTTLEVENEASQRATLSRVFPGGVFSKPQRLAGGISANATRWDVTLPSGVQERVVVRAPTWDGTVSPERMRSEARVLELANRLGLPAPRLHGTDVEGQRLVLEFLEGRPNFELPLPDMATAQLARTLAAIHGVTARSHDLSFLRRRAESVERILAQVPAVLDDELAERRVRDALTKHRPSVPNASVLLHGDYWPGNVVWRQDTLVAVIDWEEAEVGDPLADLAIARLDLLWAFDRDVMERFTELYVSPLIATNELIVEHLAWWDLVAALRPMSHLERWASAYPAPPISRPDVTAEYMAEKHRWFVAQALQRWQ